MGFELKNNSKYIEYISQLCETPLEKFEVIKNFNKPPQSLDKKDIIKIFSWCVDRCFLLLKDQKYSIEYLSNYCFSFFKYLNFKKLFVISDSLMLDALFLLFKIKELSLISTKDAFVDYCKKYLTDNNLNFITANIILSGLIQFDCVLIDLDFTAKIVNFLNSISLDKSSELILLLFHI